MDDRRLAEALVTLPVGRLGEREVDLHLGASVPEAASTLAQRRRDLDLGEQPLVQLRRRHVRDHGATRVDPLTVRQDDPRRAPGPDVDPLDVAPGLAGATVVANQLDERFGELRTAAAGNRHAALLHRHRDHLRHEPRRGGVRAEAGVQHPRSEEPVRALRREHRLQPVPGADEQVSRERGCTDAPQPAHRLHGEPEAGASPQLGAEHAERQVGVREEPVEHLPPRLPVARVVPVELRRICIRSAQQERRLPVRVRRRRGELGVEVLEPARRQFRAEQRVGCPTDPQRVPGTEDVVLKAGLRQLGRPHRPTEPVVPLEHADTPTGPCQQRPARERVDPTADDDRVVLGHRLSSPPHAPNGHVRCQARDMSRSDDTWLDTTGASHGTCPEATWLGGTWLPVVSHGRGR